MKRITGLLFTLIFLPYFACGSSQPPAPAPAPIPPPDAATMADFLTFYTGSFQQEADLLFGYADCAAVHALIDSGLGDPIPFNCDKGGKYTVTVSELQCNDGPPLTISVKTNIKYEACGIAGDLTLNGDESVPENRDGSSVMWDDVANGLQVADTAQADNFVFDVDIHFEATQGSPGICSGTITVNEQTCDVSADCKACPFP